MKSLLAMLFLSCVAFAQTTITNSGDYCLGPSQSARCQMEVVSPVELAGTPFEITFGTVTMYNPFGNSVLLNGVRYTDVVWTAVPVGNSTYIRTGKFNGGQATTVQTLQLFCRAGRVGGCHWTDFGGTTTY